MKRSKPTAPAGRACPGAAGSAASRGGDAEPRRPPASPQRGRRGHAVNIGKSVVIKGELNGSEDLTIEGHVEGKIELRRHVLTIGPNGKIKAQVFAKSVIVLGEVTGNVTASEKVDIRDNGSVDGDIVSPRVAIAEGAHFRGSVDMQKRGRRRPSARPAAASRGAAAGRPATPAAAGASRQPPHGAGQPW